MLVHFGVADGVGATLVHAANLKTISLVTQFVVVAVSVSLALGNNGTWPDTSSCRHQDLVRRALTDHGSQGFVINHPANLLIYTR